MAEPSAAAKLFDADLCPKAPAMKNILLRVNPVVVGVVAMFAITFVYVEIQPEYLPVASEAGYALQQ
jgi:hypothetical protein